MPFEIPPPATASRVDSCASLDSIEEELGRNFSIDQLMDKIVRPV